MNVIFDLNNIGMVNCSKLTLRLVWLPDFCYREVTVNIRSILYLIFIAYTSVSNAGVATLTFHSRANCANNESISWHLGHNYLLRTVSYHYRSRDLVHIIDTGREATWRSAAVHWGEGTGGWVVVGEHYGVNQYGRDSLIAKETVIDCSIYNGWWD